MMGMSNDEVVAFNKGVIAEVREHDGAMPEGSVFHGNPTLLMTMTGAKSYQEQVERTIPLFRLTRR